MFPIINKSSMNYLSFSIKRKNFSSLLSSPTKFNTFTIYKICYLKTIKKPIYSCPIFTITTFNTIVIKYLLISIKSCIITLSINISIWNPRKFSNRYIITKFISIITTITSRFFTNTINSMTI